MNNLKDILSQSNKDIDNQKLMDYLSGKLSETEQHDIEKQLSETDFEAEALEGLKQLPPTYNYELTAYELNKKLHQQLKYREQKKKRHKNPHLSTIILAIIIVLGLTALAFLIIWMRNKNG